jgi:small-conductance mechanosensitive channel
MQFLEFSQLQWQEIGISALIIVLGYPLGRTFIMRIILPILRRFISRTQTTLDDTVLEVAAKPAVWLLFVFIFQFAIERLDFLTSNININLEDIYFIAYFSILFFLAWQVTAALSAWYQDELARTQKSDLGAQLMPFLSRVALILLTGFAGIILFGHFNIEVSGLVATLGIGSLAIALAAQAALADTISGFIIMIDRPYRIGDRIEILELSTWGDVTDIGLRSTRIRTRDNRMAIVPNSVIAKSMVVNHSYPDDKYRLQIELGIAYGSDLEAARKIMIEAVEKVEGVLKDRPVEALFLEFGDSSLIFRVRWWLDSYVDTRRMFDHVNSAIYTALQKAGIELPFPQRDVNFKIDKQQQKNITEVFREAK